MTDGAWTGLRFMFLPSTKELFKGNVSSSFIDTKTKIADLLTNLIDLVASARTKSTELVFRHGAVNNLRFLFAFSKSRTQGRFLFVLCGDVDFDFVGNGDFWRCWYCGHGIRTGC